MAHSKWHVIVDTEPLTNHLSDPYMCPTVVFYCLHSTKHPVPYMSSLTTRFTSFSSATLFVTSKKAALPFTSIVDTWHVAFSAYKRALSLLYTRDPKSQWNGSTLFIHRFMESVQPSHFVAIFNFPFLNIKTLPDFHISRRIDLVCPRRLW